MTDTTIIPQPTARFDPDDLFRGATKMMHTAHGVHHGKN
jgi:hypothetical protein